MEYTDKVNTYFGQRNPAKGKIQKWNNYPTYGFPYEMNCEECGWRINIAENKIIQLIGYHGSGYYHTHCWDYKKKVNRIKPKHSSQYGYKYPDGYRSPAQADADWIWSKEHTRFEKHCKKCNKMMCVFRRLSRIVKVDADSEDYTRQEYYTTYPDKCGWCVRKEIIAATKLEMSECHCSNHSTHIRKEINAALGDHK